MPATGPRPPLQRRQWLLLAVTFTSGLVSLALEVLWTRMMLQGTGSSIYVFIAVVAVFLIGIAGGSLVYERQRDRSPQLATLGALLAVAAALAVVPMIVSNVYGPAWLPFAVLLILPVTVIFGYTFPLTVRLFVDSAEQASRGVGLVYAANTAGCVAGTVLAGFVLIPALGTSASIIVVGPGPGGARRRAGDRVRAARDDAAPGGRPGRGGGTAGDALHPGRQADLRPARGRRDRRPDRALRGHRGLGRCHRRPAGNRNLFINGVGITKLTITTKLLAYVPKAARPDATTMLNICFGMGTTFRSSIILGLHTTAVDLDPTVPSVMPWFYPDASTYLHSPLGQVIISDGRNYVRLSNKRYDLITVDPPAADLERGRGGAA